MTVVLLSCRSSFKYQSVFRVNGVFKCNNWAVNFKLSLDMIYFALCKYLNYAADKIIDAGHTASTDCQC